MVSEEDGVESVEMVDESDRTIAESVEDDGKMAIRKFANESGLLTPRRELGCRKRCTRMYRNEREKEVMKLKPRILSGTDCTAF